MTETTPYDRDRAGYTREALARLVLSEQAVELSDSAAGLVGTRYDTATGLGGRASQARQLVELAERALASAVVYERERGSSWEEIAAYLGIDAEEAEQRFGPAVRAWHTAFEEPYRLDETGRKRIPALPTAAYDPAWACHHLDGWARLRGIGIGESEAVSASLTRVPAAPPAVTP
ncbi:hypothetical protein ACFYNO_17030 [Kitasatospora sp. NPDC006697]|uniref:hypothetical protein n=1 Tax=Kitasatospora sp. NPDC006697 TaxID=3364020 RepID=UPI00367533EC